MGHRTRRIRGLSLFELVFTVALAAILLAVSLTGLRQSADKGSSIALGGALSDEFRAARQLAVSKGCPVAVGIPAGGDRTADSLYRLEGWNTPHVTYSVSYKGDYPELSFAAVGWSGAEFKIGISQPPLSKFGAFSLDDWLPDEHKQDAVFCFTPDGGVVGNGLPSLNERYTVVIAHGLAVSGGSAVAGNEPSVVYLSVGGAVDVSKQLPGVALTSGSASGRAPAKLREELSGTAKIRLSKIAVRPESGDADADAYCTPGQQVTFEVYAYDPKGRELFAQWSQTGPGAKKGNFGFPSGRGGVLQSEVERMEYLEDLPPGLDWGSANAPPGGCFRARWTWTVPQDSDPGDLFTVTANVQDATGTAEILNPPAPASLKSSPKGRLLAEIVNGGRSELVRMNPDGSGRVYLTGPGVEELMPSVDGTGTKLAFLQGPVGNPNQRCVKVRSLSGGGEFRIAGPGRYTTVSISPDGAWISYRLDSATNQGQGTLYIHRIDQSPSSGLITAQNWLGSDVLDIEPERTGWSRDSRYALWGHENRIQIADLGSAGNVTNKRDLYTQTRENEDLGGIRQQVYAPTVFNPGSGDRLLFTVSTSNPVIVHVPFNPNHSTYGNARNEPPNETPALKIDLNGSQADYGSGSYDDNFAAVSQNGRRVILPRIDRPAGNKRYAMIARWDDGLGNFVATPTEKNTIQDDIRCVVWVP